MARRKVTVVGAGLVGAATAQQLGEAELADVTLIDVVEGMPQGKALDLQQGAAVRGVDTRYSGSNDLADLRGSEVVVVTAGLPRKPGMSRDDLLLKNAEIVGGVADAIKQHAPESIVIIVSNPLDVMTWLAWKRTGFPTNRVMGMAGVLDSARYAAFIAMELKVSVKDIRAMVLGGHGDLMVPLPQFTTVSGVPVTELIAPDRLAQLADRTRNGGAEIVNLLKTGSASYAPGVSAAAMVQAVLHDTRRLLPVCTRLDGAYGLRDVFIGVPAVLGAKGIESVTEIKLTEQERQALHASAQNVRENCEKLAKLTGM